MASLERATVGVMALKGQGGPLNLSVAVGTGASLSHLPADL
jgi:hypothetical protein